MKHTIATFRWKMVQVAGRIVKHAGEMVLKLMIDLELEAGLDLQQAPPIDSTYQ